MSAKPAGPVALSAAEVRARLQTRPAWRVVTTRDASATRGRRVELARTLEFGKGKAAFKEAVRFMASLADAINRKNHHPRWENEWVRVRVWLTTHDAGSRLTAKDFDVARLVDERFAARRRA